MPATTSAMTPSQVRRMALDAAICDDYMRKMPIAEIMEKHGVARETVYAAVKRNGFDLHHPRRKSK